MSAIVSLIALIFGPLWRQHAELFQDSHGAMGCFMWHKDQKYVLAFTLKVLAIVYIVK